MSCLEGAYDGDIGLRSQFQIGDGQLWQFEAKPMTAESATSLYMLGGNKPYLEQLVESLARKALQQDQCPTKDSPLFATVSNGEHGEIDLRFWLTSLAN
ncbi:MAG: hypothetical protein H6922_03475 [Pseudomonadaceae bacterium]|nr:hypothetical protein [Pseudomonadaceae bacterium]